MKKRFHLIGLWRVWNESEAWSIRRRPDALMERFAGSYDEEPDDQTVGRDLQAAGEVINEDHDDLELIGSVVLDDTAWKALTSKDGWTSGTLRQHPMDGLKPEDFLIYGIEEVFVMDKTSALWKGATDYGPSCEALADKFKAEGDALGLPPAEVYDRSPVFEGFEERQKRRRAERDGPMR